MARNVKFEIRRGAGSSLEVLFGKVSLTPTMLHTVANSVVLPAPSTFDLVNGVAIATNVAPSPAPVEGQVPWAYKVKITDNYGKSWEYLVGVPDGTSEINFNVLPRYFETKPPLFGQGEQGVPGSSATIAIGTTTSGPTPAVTNTGTSTDAVLNFTLPKGDKGDTGAGVPTGGTALQVVRKNAANTTTEWATIDKSLVGLGNVDNTSDANKPVSTAQQTAIDAVSNGLDNKVTTFAQDSSSAFGTYLNGKFVEMSSLAANVMDYGAVGDGVTDDYEAITAAIGGGGRNVYLPAGVYLHSQEIKLPSNTTFSGAGRGITTLLTATSLHVNQNSVTNDSNNRLARTSYDSNIHIRDITIDSNGYNRAPGASADQGCGVKFSTVELSSLVDVEVFNAPLHCFDICASIYQDATEVNVNTIVAGPSRNVNITRCLAVDSLKDDGFTTHGSHDINITDCVSLKNDIPALSQQGFEVDEGSYRVNITNAYAKGWSKGFQVKGHTTTTPAYAVNLTNCVAESCNYGFDISFENPSSLPPGAVSWAKDVKLLNCTSLNPVVRTPDYTELKAIQIRGYRDVIIENFRAKGGAHNNVTLADGCTNISFSNFVGENIWQTPRPGQGYFHGYSTAAGDYKFANIVIDGAIGGTVIQMSSGSSNSIVEGLYASAAPSASYPAIYRSHLGNFEVYKNLKVSGFSTQLQVAAGSSKGGLFNNVDIGRGYNAYYSGTGSPEGKIAAFPGSTYVDTNGGTSTLWIKQTGNESTGWAAK